MKFTCYEVTLENLASKNDATRMQRALGNIKDQLVASGDHRLLGENNIHRFKEFELRSWSNETHKSYSYFYKNFIFAQVVEGPRRSKIKVVDKTAIKTINGLLQKITSNPQSMFR